MAQIKKMIDPVIKEKCSELGFEKKKHLYAKSLTDDAWGLLYFSCATYPGYREIGVHVMITFKSVEKLNCLLWNIPFGKWGYWVVSNNIGYLGPEAWYKEWEFKEDCDMYDIHRIVNKMFKYIKKYALPFYDKMADIKAVIDLYEHNSRLIDRQRGKLTILPLLYLMEGEKQKGVDAINEVVNNGYRLSNEEQMFIDNYMSYSLP